MHRRGALRYRNATLPSKSKRKPVMVFHAGRGRVVFLTHAEAIALFQSLRWSLRRGGQGAW